MFQSLITVLLLAHIILPSVCTYSSGMHICNDHMKYLGDLTANPASSCQQVYNLRSDATSGYYWIQDGCCLVKVYCVMNHTECGGGVWTEIANVNMSIPSNVCPSGLEKVSTPKSCRKTNDSGCSNTTFKTYNLQYKSLYGKIIGYQISSLDAFYPYHGLKSFKIFKIQSHRMMRMLMEFY